RAPGHRALGHRVPGRERVPRERGPAAEAATRPSSHTVNNTPRSSRRPGRPSRSRAHHRRRRMPPRPHRPRVHRRHLPHRHRPPSRPRHRRPSRPRRRHRTRIAVRMSPQRFEELVSDALDLIPPDLAAAIDNVVVLVEDRNDEEPDLLGLYQGVALTERDSWYAGSLPDTITIYREALLDMCDTEEQVVEEVAITVIHEIAHHFGIDDDRLHELGWG